MLTDAAARKAKPDKDRPYKLADAGGLYLRVTPAGGKVWRLKYRFHGTEKVLTIGAYPDVPLADARKERDRAKDLLARGVDPMLDQKKAAAAAELDARATFETVAREWHKKIAPTWSKVHAGDVLDSLERDVFPALGRLPIKAITPPLMLQTMQAIENRQAIETARRIRQRCSAVFVYAIAAGIGETDPAAIIEGAMAPLPKKGKHPALTALADVREMLRRAEADCARPITKLAHRLLALTVVRPGELRRATWPEFADECWTVPPERMKLRVQMKDEESRAHLVPLSRQAHAVLSVLFAQTGRLPYVFPSVKHAHKPMSKNAVAYLIDRAGYQGRHCPHGWRTSFSTILNEMYPLEGKIIDFQLAHVPKDEVEGAYNRAKYLTRRRELMQEWADMLLEGFAGPETLLLGPRRR